MVIEVIRKEGNAYRMKVGSNILTLDEHILRQIDREVWYLGFKQVSTIMIDANLHHYPYDKVFNAVFLSVATNELAEVAEQFLNTICNIYIAEHEKYIPSQVRHRLESEIEYRVLLKHLRDVFPDRNGGWYNFAETTLGINRETIQKYTVDGEVIQGFLSRYQKDALAEDQSNATQPVDIYGLEKLKQFKNISSITEIGRVANLDSRYYLFRNPVITVNIGTTPVGSLLSDYKVSEVRLLVKHLNQDRLAVNFTEDKLIEIDPDLTEESDCDVEEQDSHSEDQNTDNTDDTERETTTDNDANATSQPPKIEPKYRRIGDASKIRDFNISIINEFKSRNKYLNSDEYASLSILEKEQWLGQYYQVLAQLLYIVPKELVTLEEEYEFLEEENL